MNCAHTQALLDEYVDGELPASDAARVEAHLRGCGNCRQSAEELRAISARISTLPAPTLPEGFAQRLFERLPLDAPPALSRHDTTSPGWLVEDTSAFVAEPEILHLARRAA